MACNEHQPINRNYAAFNFRMMQLFGIWNPYQHGFSFWMYRFYTATVFTSIVFVYTFLEIIDAITVKDDLELFTENICLTMTHLAGIAKIINLWMRKSKIYDIVDILERVLRQKDEGLIGELQDKIINRAIWQGTLVTKVFEGLVFFTATVGMAYPFWDQTYKEWKFPYRCYFPMNTNESTVYWISFTFIGLSITGQAFIILLHDALFVVFMIHVVAQISILKNRIEILCINSKFKDAKRSTNIIFGTETNNEPLIELNSCIKYHQGIIRLVSELESMFSNVILLQFVTSLVIIGLTGFQVTVSTRGGRFLPMAGYLCCILLELLLYCWFGNEIISQSGSLRNSAYVCSWYNEDLKFCKTLNIFMARMQKPLVVTAGKFCDLSLETFVVILSRSYSYMAVLNQMNE